MVNDPEHDERVARLLEQALRLPAEARASFLRDACQDSTLHDEIAEALSWEERMGSFLKTPMLSLVDLARPFRVGEFVAGRFELLREIGEGGMGVVYEAFDRTRRQNIAIKAAKPGFQSLLSPELEGALKVRHPNICVVNEIHTAATDRGPIDFLTMELLEGETLDARLRVHGSPARGEALNIARQLCAGLSEAHRSNVLHRDFKPANIMLSRGSEGQLRVVIMDFGLAGGIAEAGELAGTPAYMAPELLAGGRASKASDIYALGVILRELAGEKPGTRWERVIERCLDRRPAARFADAGKVLHALERKPIRTDRLLAGSVAVIAVLSLLPPVRGWLADHLWPPPPNVRLAVLPLTNAPEEAPGLSGVLQDVAGRVAKLRSDRRTVVVLSPQEVSENHVDSVEEARDVLHVTHVLKTTVTRHGPDFQVHASVINVDTQTSMGETSGRYSADTLGNMPSALTGAVSLALRLEGAGTSETLNAAASLPYDQGLQRLRDPSGSKSEAIALFTEAARLDPRSTLPLAAQVEAQIAEFRLTRDAARIGDARRTLSVADSINPDSVAVLLAAGSLAEVNGEYERARESYQRVQQLDSRNVDAYLRLAGIDDALDMPERAIGSYRKAIALEPGYFKSYHHFGVFYYYRGEYAEAAEQLQKAVDRAPGRLDAYTDLAAALSDLGDDRRAEQALRASLEIRETADALNSLGAIRAFAKNDGEAITHYRRAVQLEPGSYIYWLNLGDSARRLGSTAEASKAYSQALQLARADLAQNPRLGISRAYAAYFAARLGEARNAIDGIAEAMKFAPADRKVMRRAILTYEALGMREESLRVLATANADLLRELRRHPDMGSLSSDPRFLELNGNTSGGSGDGTP